MPPKRNAGGAKGRMGKRRLRIAEEQSWLCFWCRRKMVPTDPNGTPVTPLTLTADHIIPLSRGGYNAKLNLVAACSQCNLARDRAGDPKLFFPPWAVPIAPPKPRKPRKPGCDILKRLRKWKKQKKKSKHRPRTTLAEIWPVGGE